MRSRGVESRARAAVRSGCHTGMREMRIPGVHVGKIVSGTKFRLLSAAFVILCGVCTAGSAPILGQSTSAKYEVKAEYLYNFAKFVEWPANAFPSDNSPIIVCVFGKDPFSGDLETTVLGKTLGGRPFETRHTRRFEELHLCQMVFVSSGEARHIPKILTAVKSAPVLLVGDSRNFAEEGGEIGFVLQDGKVHFVVNVDAVERAHLKVSSKLLSLARIVHDPGANKEN